MNFDFSSSVVAAVAVIVVVLVLEEWAFFAARTKTQRAIITGAAVFVLVIVFNLIPGALG